MPWGKVDDTAHHHRKFRRAGMAATGLYFLSISYCGDYLTDGYVDQDWIDEKVPRKVEREKLLTALVDQGLFEPNGTGYVIHDYLVANPSRAEVEKRREEAAERQRRARERESRNAA